MLPVAGEALDVAVLLDDEASTVDKGIASASLAVNAVTFGLLPNFGAVHRSGSRCRWPRQTGSSWPGSQKGDVIGAVG
jgi:hypothetical protein